MSRKPITTVDATISVPIPQVWGLLAESFADVNKYSTIIRNSWISGSQTTGVGTKRRSELHSSSGFVEEVITAWEPNRLIEMQVKNTSLRFAGAILRYELEEENGITTITAYALLPTRFPWKRLVAKGQINRWLRDYLQDLCRTLEK